MTGIMTRLAIFDLDGTLLDTVKDLGNATNHALTECGFPTHPIEAYYQMVGLQQVPGRRGKAGPPLFR